MMTTLIDDMMSDLDDELRRSKQRVLHYRRQAKQGQTKEAKLGPRVSLAAKESQIRTMRQHIFGAQDAIEAAVTCGDATLFADYQAIFPKTGEILVAALANVNNTRRTVCADN